MPTPTIKTWAITVFLSKLLIRFRSKLQDRLTVCTDAFPSLSVAVSKISKSGGVGAFYAGLSPTLISMLPYSTCYYFMYEMFKKSYCLSKKKKCFKSNGDAPGWSSLRCDILAMKHSYGYLVLQASLEMVF